MSQQLTTISLEAIQYMCGLIRDLASVSEGIDDLHLLSNGTFSSVKIDTLLNTLRSDCNEYTDRLVANLSRLELKIANDESEISQPNIMYLYKASGETSYSQYVVIEGTKVLLGNCDIDMGDYYTITQADAKFVLKTDFDSLKTEVDKKLNKTDVDNITIINAEGVNIKDFILENCTNKNKSYYIIARHSCADIPTVNTNYFMTVENAGYYTIKVTAKELAGKNNEYMCTYRSDNVKWTNWEKVLVSSDIVTTIDSSSVDDKIPSAKAVFDNAIKDKNLNTYSDVTQLGLTTPITVGEIFNTLPNNSLLRVQNDNGTISDAPYVNGILIIDKVNQSKFSIEFKISASGGIGDNGLYIGQLQGSDGSGLTWRRVCTTSSVKNVSWATISESTLTNTTFVPGGTCSYSIENGECFIRFNGLTTSSGVYITAQDETFPKPNVKITNGHYPLITSNGTAVMCIISSSGGLTIKVTSSIGDIYTTISYPVAES